MLGGSLPILAIMQKVLKFIYGTKLGLSLSADWQAKLWADPGWMHYHHASFALISLCMAISPCDHARNKCSHGVWKLKPNTIHSPKQWADLTTHFGMHPLFVLRGQASLSPEADRERHMLSWQIYSVFSSFCTHLMDTPHNDALKYSGKKYIADLYQQHKPPMQWFPSLESSLKNSWIPAEMAKTGSSYNTAVWASTSMQLRF